jgi:hypothetical protein
MGGANNGGLFVRERKKLCRKNVLDIENRL